MYKYLSSYYFHNKTRRPNKLQRTARSLANRLLKPNDGGITFSPNGGNSTYGFDALTLEARVRRGEMKYPSPRKCFHVFIFKYVFNCYHATTRTARSNCKAMRLASLSVEEPKKKMNPGPCPREERAKEKELHREIVATHPVWEALF